MIGIGKTDMTRHDIQKKMEDNDDFEPSMRILSRILKILLEKDSMLRTDLTTVVNTNYPTVSKYLRWLERRSVVTYVVNDGVVNVRMNQAERQFVLKLLNFKN